MEAENIKVDTDAILAVPRTRRQDTLADAAGIDMVFVV